MIINEIVSILEDFRSSGYLASSDGVVTTLCMSRALRANQTSSCSYGAGASKTITVSVYSRIAVLEGVANCDDEIL